jgi:hypothetical protein
MLKKPENSIPYIVVDVTESPIQRPKKQKEYYSGKKKRHTIKTQVLISRKSKEILDIREAKGSVHDFKVFKDTIETTIEDSILIVADLGYLGIEKLYAKSEIPKKASKKHKLNKGEKEYNIRLARKRVVIEQKNAKIKTFKSMAYPYRNHCGRHLLRMSLICSIINFELRI